jgi:ankyrin repeat protein
MRGFFNLIEYFIKERKLTPFLDQFDLASNTPLHLATENGHASIVNILLEHGIDVCAKNEENMTALDVSCRKGYFEISKIIINNYSSFNKNDRLNEFPLHTVLIS